MSRTIKYDEGFVVAFDDGYGKPPPSPRDQWVWMAADVHDQVAGLPVTVNTSIQANGSVFVQVYRPGSGRIIRLREGEAWGSQA
jgi:hypothetical protein